MSLVDLWWYNRVMPHDKHGSLVTVGAEVTIRARVESVQEGEDYCNVTVRTLDPMPPYPAGTCITLNTKQVELKPDEG